MAWADFPDVRQSVPLLRRSLERGRLGHAYLFSGESAPLLERVARELAMTVNCTTPSERSPTGSPVAACGTCSSCRRIREGLHPDVYWLRAESKSRIVRVEQVRDLLHAVQLKPTEAAFKVGVIVGADRLNPQAANAFLKTLEEPPRCSLLILLSTEPERLLETIVSRCLRLVFPSELSPTPAQLGWLRSLSAGMQTPPKSLLHRYLLLDGLLQHLAAARAQAEETVATRTTTQESKDTDPKLREQWEEEAVAATEAEYRQQRGLTLQLLQNWLRDVWVATLHLPDPVFTLPELVTETQAIAARLDPDRAMANLQLLEETQSLLHTNVQEALALEVAMLRLDL